MMRYLVFAFDHYYPEGGLKDVVMVTSDWSAAEQMALIAPGQGAQILDVEKMQMFVRDDGGVHPACAADWADNRLPAWLKT